MREPQKKTIDGVTYEVTPLGFKKGRRAFTRVAKILGPVLGAAESLDSLGGRNVSAMLERLLTEVGDDDLDWFADVFGATTRFSRDGDKWPYLNESNREALFGGNLLAFFQWLVFCLEVNFSDFLGLLRKGKPGGVPSAAESQAD